MIARHLPMKFVDSIESATLVIDDIVYGGCTLQTYNLKNIPAFALLSMGPTSVALVGQEMEGSDPVIMPWTHQTNGKGSISDVIRNRIVKAGGSYMANDNISACMEDGDIELLQKEVTEKVDTLLGSLVIDKENDYNIHDTAKRIAKMYLTEVFHGRYAPMPRIARFPNTRKLDEIYTVGPIGVRSACSHHFVPILGEVWIGVVPSDQVIGLSKFSRITEWVMSRPHIQEEAIMELADQIENLVEPKGVAIAMRATHLCMVWRGVKEHKSSTMVNVVTRGVFNDPEHNFYDKFMNIIRAQKF